MKWTQEQRSLAIRQTEQMIMADGRFATAAYNEAALELACQRNELLEALKAWSPWGEDVAATLDWVADFRDSKASRSDSIECLSPYLRKMAGAIREAISKAEAQ